MDPFARNRPAKTLLTLSPRQQAAFWRRDRFLALRWASGTGKTHVIAAWAIFRLLTRRRWKVTVLCAREESATNFIALCMGLCRELRILCIPDATPRSVPFSRSHRELRVCVGGDWNRLLVRPATPTQAGRGSGDLILDDLDACNRRASVWAAARKNLLLHPEARCRAATAAHLPLL